MKKRFFTVALTVLIAASGARAGVDEDTTRVRQEWERIKYQVPASEQANAFERLAKDSEKLATQYPDRAEPVIWHGIIEASYAGAKGGLGALSLVKQARIAFERAIALDAKALDGSAYTSLGSLYYQVPGWPIGFGDDKKALDLLQKGLAINPNGIDPNFFLGDYYLRMGDLEAAERALRKALAAPAREGRALADEGRRKEINALLERIREKQR